MSIISLQEITHLLDEHLINDHTGTALDGEATLEGEITDGHH